MKTRILPFLIFISVGLVLWGAENAFAFNLWTDVTQNTKWTFGQAAQAGEGYDFASKKWDTSALAEVAEYRCLALSYGATFLDANSSTATDTVNVGFLSNFFFKMFANQPPPSMAWVENLNIGPSYAVPVFSGATGHKGVFLLDVNFKFSGS